MEKLDYKKRFKELYQPKPVLSVIRQPEFVTKEVFITACEITAKKKPHLNLSKARLNSRIYNKQKRGILHELENII